jgi:hypothetical protein
MSKEIAEEGNLESVEVEMSSVRERIEIIIPIITRHCKAACNCLADAVWLRIHQDPEHWRHGFTHQNFNKTN